MPGIEVSLARALDGSPKWRAEEPLKVALPPGAAEARQGPTGEEEGEASSRSSTAGTEEPQKVSFSPVLPWACSLANGDVEPPSAPAVQLPLRALLPEESDCCDAMAAWGSFYDADAATASPATSSGSDYDSSLEGDALYSAGFDPLRLWDPLPLLAAEPPSCTAEAAELPTRGSSLHESGQCRPCAWVYKTVGCTTGFDCDFCHLCPEGMLKAKKKTKMAMKAMSRQNSSQSAQSPQDMRRQNSSQSAQSPQDQPRLAISLASLV